MACTDSAAYTCASYCCVLVLPIHLSKLQLSVPINQNKNRTWPNMEKTYRNCKSGRFPKTFLEILDILFIDISLKLR